MSRSIQARAVGYWICTVVVGLSFLSGGAANLWSPEAIAGITRLGYPPHFVAILAVWKILGGVAILVPGFARLKEWAYAGMIFELTGAAAAHAAVGDADAWLSNAGHILAPLVLAGLVVASWAMRPEPGLPIRPIGHVRSSLVSRAQAPLQGSEGAPDAWLDLDERVQVGLGGIAVGQEIILLTWFHQARRDVLEVHPRGDPRNPLSGVFATRSPDRPNPIGLHRVRVTELAGNRTKVGPLEAIDGTPIVDIKPVLAGVEDD